MRYYLNATPPPPLMNRFLVLERRWQKQSASLPHLTIVSPRILLPNKSEDELVMEIINATQHISKFPIRLMRIGSFNDKENIHACVERTQEIVACHRKLLEATQGILAPATGLYTHLEHPHITISDHIANDQREAAWDALSRETFEDTFTCEHIHLMRRGEHDHTWTTVFSYPLL